MKIFMLISIIFGVGALIMDAFIAHGLESFIGERFSTTVHHAMATAARYQLIFALFLFVLSLSYKHYPSRWLIGSQVLMIIGVLLFSGTIYLKHLATITGVSFLAPIGGISLMLSFLSLLPLLFWL